MKKTLYYWIFQTFWLEGSIVPMKATLERLGLEQPKVSECWNKGEHGNFAISFMRPPGIFQGLSGAMLSFKVRFLKNHHFLQLRDPSILRELHSFPCSLPYTSHYVSTFFLARFSSQMELRHEELATKKWRKGWSWWFMVTKRLKLRIGLSVSTKFAMSQPRCYRIGSFQQHLRFLWWIFPTRVRWPSFHAMAHRYNVLSSIESACRHACLCVRTYIHAYAQQWVFANEAWPSSSGLWYLVIVTQPVREGVLGFSFNSKFPGWWMTIIVIRNINTNNDKLLMKESLHQLIGSLSHY